MLGHQMFVAGEKRAADRIRANLKAAIFLASEETEIECFIENLSVDGAGIRCESRFDPGSRLVLYIQGFGRFEAVVERIEKDYLGVSFHCGTLKRQRLAEQILSYLKNGGVSKTHLRRHERTPTTSLGELTLEDGGTLSGKVLDVSLLGVSIKTDQRPPIGSTVHVGKTLGRVVRHHDDGIGVQFSTGS
jgi:hypothetical protein